MSGIDEHILGDCFIETKPKSLPTDEKSTNESQKTGEPESKIANRGIFIDEEANANHDSEDFCDQGADDFKTNEIYDFGFEKQLGCVSNKFRKYSNDTTSSYCKLNSNKAYDVEVLKSCKRSSIGITYGERYGNAPFNDQIYSTSNDKLLVRERKASEVYSSNRFGNMLNVTKRTNDTINGGIVGVGETNMYHYRRVELKGNVRATDLSGKGSLKERKTVKNVGKFDVREPVLFYPFDETSDDSSLTRESRKSANLRRKWEKLLDDENLHKNEVMSKAVKAKTRRKQKVNKTGHTIKVHVANKVEADNDLFDITPVKDTPWSPSQDESGDINQSKKKKPARKTKTVNKKTKTSYIIAQDLESKDDMSIQTSTEIRRPGKNSTFTSIGCGNVHSEITPVESGSIFNVAPAEKRRESLDIGNKDKSHKNPNENDGNIATRRNDNLYIDNPSLVRDLVEGKHDSLINHTYNQNKSRLKRKKKKMEKIDKGKDLPSDKSDIHSIEPYYPQKENIPDKNLHSIQNRRKCEPYRFQKSYQQKSALLPIIEENIDTGSEDDLEFTKDGEGTEQDNKPNLTENDDSLNDSVSLISLHGESKACAGEVDTSSINDTENRTGRLKRFTNWLICCFKPKVDD